MPPIYVTLIITPLFCFTTYMLSSIYTLSSTDEGMRTTVLLLYCLMTVMVMSPYFRPLTYAMSRHGYSYGEALELLGLLVLVFAWQVPSRAFPGLPPMVILILMVQLLIIALAPIFCPPPRIEDPYPPQYSYSEEQSYEDETQEMVDL
jgi:hypothetical protein